VGGQDVGRERPEDAPERGDVAREGEDPPRLVESEPAEDGEARILGAPCEQAAPRRRDRHAVPASRQLPRAHEDTRRLPAPAAVKIEVEYAQGRLGRWAHASPK